MPGAEASIKINTVSTSGPWELERLLERTRTQDRCLYPEGNAPGGEGQRATGGPREWPEAGFATRFPQFPRDLDHVGPEACRRNPGRSTKSGC